MMSSLRHLWNIPIQVKSLKIETSKKCVESLDKIISDSKQILILETLEKSCFEFDMASNNIKRFERGWEWEDFKGSVGSYQRFGFDPFEYHIPNAVAFTHDPLFYNPDYSVLYWKELQMDIS